MSFRSGPYSLRVRGPDSSTIDELDCTDDEGNLVHSPPFDVEAMAERLAEEIVGDLTFENNRILKIAVQNALEQAKRHCDTCHQDVREKFKKAKPVT